MPNFISDEVKDLIMRMLQPNPIKRINMKEIRQHDWFMGRSNSNPEGSPLIPQYLCLWDRSYRQKDHTVDELIIEQLFKVRIHNTM